jgi:hypothetical protein
MLYSLRYLCGPKIISNEFKNIFFCFQTRESFSSRRKEESLEVFEKKEREWKWPIQKKLQSLSYTPRFSVN